MITLKTMLSVCGHICASRRDELQRRLTHNRKASPAQKELVARFGEHVRAIGRLMAQGDGLGAEIDPAIVGYVVAIADGSTVKLQLVGWLNTHGLRDLGDVIDAGRVTDIPWLCRTIASHFGGRFDLH